MSAKAPTTNAQALVRIHRELDGKQWDADTLERIAEHVEAAGLKVRNYEEADDAQTTD